MYKELIWIGLPLLATVIYLLKDRAQPYFEIKGGWPDLEKLISLLYQQGRGYLILSQNSANQVGIQVMPTSEGFRIVVPLDSKPHQDLQDKLIVVCRQSGAFYQVIALADGSSHLEADGPHDPSQLCALLRQLFEKIYGFANSTELVMYCQGLHEHDAGLTS